jgi:hypothetical protein
MPTSKYCEKRVDDYAIPFYTRSLRRYAIRDDDSYGVGGGGAGKD